MNNRGLVSLLALCCMRASSVQNYVDSRAGDDNNPGTARGKPWLYMANCHLSSDWQFKQSAAVALPAVILKAGGLGPGGKGAGSPFRGPSITNSPCTGEI